MSSNIGRNSVLRISAFVLGQAFSTCRSSMCEAFSIGVRSVELPGYCKTCKLFSGLWNYLATAKPANCFQTKIVLYLLPYGGVAPSCSRIQPSSNKALPYEINSDNIVICGTFYCSISFHNP